MKMAAEESNGKVLLHSEFYKCEEFLNQLTIRIFRNAAVYGIEQNRGREETGSEDSYC
jgi:hypothetical protein